MKVLENAFWLGSEIGGFLLLLWPVTLAVGLLLVVSLVATLLRHRLTARAWWVTTPLLVVPLILVWGSAFEYHSSGGPRWAVDSLYGFLVLSVVIGVVTTIKLKGLRWLAASAALSGVWLSFCAAGLAAMSVSGVWL